MGECYAYVNAERGRQAVWMIVVVDQRGLSVSIVKDDGWMWYFVLK